MTQLDNQSRFTELGGKLYSEIRENNFVLLSLQRVALIEQNKKNP